MSKTKCILWNGQPCPLDKKGFDKAVEDARKEGLVLVVFKIPQGVYLNSGAARFLNKILSMIADNFF